MSREISLTPRCSLDDDQPTRRLLAALFWRASTPLVAALLLPGCGSDGGELGSARNELDDGSLHCDSNGRWRPMSALKLTQPVDFAALREQASGFNHPFVLQRDAAGVPCANAGDPRVCEAELRRTSLLETDPATSHLLTVHGDLVRAYTTLDEKLSLLGTIDTPDEALLVLEHQKLPVGCATSSSPESTRVSRHGDGYRISTSTRVGNSCPSMDVSYVVDVDPDGKSSIVEKKDKGPFCTAGRRPPNLLARCGRVAGGRAIARYFARNARLEAASVAAFEQLAEELRVFGAPRTLREAARRAAADEVRHARTTAALAERFGAPALAAQLARRKLRSRSEVALDNAVEGCALETYAAYLATAQARLAGQGELGRSLCEIAHDETGHAAFSWQLAAWLEPQLDRQVARQIATRRLCALRALGARHA